MDRRYFLTFAGSTAALPVTAQNYSDYTKDPRPDVPEGTLTAGSLDGPVFTGSPVVSGPAADAIVILQPLQRHATGFLEFAVEDGPWIRVDAGHAGLLAQSDHILKFRLPPLPPGKLVKYRVQAHSVGWVKEKQFYHGNLKAGAVQISPEKSFRTLDPGADKTTFAVWNDTHENAETLKSLHGLTEPLRPDFLLWNGDQSNDVHFEKDMAGQFLNPAGQAVAESRPLAYVRGNHELRGPAASALPGFTGTPDDRFYYAFRSGPLAALVMDTGEDKADDSPYFGGLIACGRMQEQQGAWLKEVVKEPWFRSAPHKVLFCHIPLWFDHPKIPNNRFRGHLHCRKHWLPALVGGGVQLVVSGHTHDFLWMPAKEGQPLAQLVGGGPQPRIATFIQCTATKAELKLKMTRLDGTLINDVVLPAKNV